MVFCLITKSLCNAEIKTLCASPAVFFFLYRFPRSDLCFNLVPSTWSHATPARNRPSWVSAAQKSALTAPSCPSPPLSIWLLSVPQQALLPHPAVIFPRTQLFFSRQPPLLSPSPRADAGLCCHSVRRQPRRAGGLLLSVSGARACVPATPASPAVSRLVRSVYVSLYLLQCWKVTVKM